MHASRWVTCLRPVAGWAVVVACWFGLGLRWVTADPVVELKDLEAKALAGEGAAQLALAIRYDGRERSDDHDMAKPFIGTKRLPPRAMRRHRQLWGSST